MKLDIPGHTELLGGVICVNVPAGQVEFAARDAALESPQILDQSPTIDVLGVVIRVSDLFEADPNPC